METCTQAQGPDYKRTLRALLFLRPPRITCYVWWEQGDSEENQSGATWLPSHGHLAPLTWAPSMHGVPRSGMEAGLVGVHKAGLLTCCRITWIVTFC